MKVNYLGTAAAEGWPALFCNCVNCQKARQLGGKNIRTRSQALIDDELLIDIPPDTYMHMLQSGLDLPHIHNIIITHTHQDHCYIEELMMRSKIFANNIDGVLNVYGNDKLIEKYQALNGTEPYHAHLKETLQFSELKEFVPAGIGNHIVTPLLANHNKAEKCYIYLIERDGKRLLYGNDTGYFPQKTWEYLAGKVIDFVSLDCTMLKHKDGNNHMGIEDVQNVKEQMTKLHCVNEKTIYVLTHFSHNGELMHDEIGASAEPLGFMVAYDGCVFHI